MRGVRCFGETKFFRQCPRHVVNYLLDGPCFCWEHINQREIRIGEISKQTEHTREELEWAPLGAFSSNYLDDYAVNEITETRLFDISLDDQNVHTPEIQQSVGKSIKKLGEWAKQEKIKTEKNLHRVILSTIVIEQDELVSKALAHIEHCYQWSDDTSMFGTTYPQLASWVWARVNSNQELKEILQERFFEEVAESEGQCLNGNMARLINVFAALDLEMSPQETRTFIDKDEMQRSISIVLKETEDMREALEKVKDLLKLGQVPPHEFKHWLQSVEENYVNSGLI